MMVSAHPGMPLPVAVASCRAQDVSAIAAGLASRSNIRRILATIGMSERVGECRSKAQGMPGREMANPNVTGSPGPTCGCVGTAGSDLFDTCDGVPGKEAHHALPVIRRPILQRFNAIARVCARVVSAGAGPPASSGSGLAHGAVETAHAAKPRGERDIGHGQHGFGQQLLGEQ